MADLSGFNPAEHEPLPDFTPLPKGDYVCTITESERRATNAGTGHYLLLVVEVIDGQYAGRKLFDRLNIWNPNEQAVAIAKRTLSSICNAVGVTSINDSSDLHNRPLKVTVGIETRKDNGEFTNRIKGYKPAATPGQGTPAPQAPAQGAPWM